MPTPSILYVVNDAAFFRSHRLPLARGALAEGYEVHVAVPSGPAVRALECEGLALHAIPLTRRGMRPWEEANTIRALARLYRSLAPDLVHHVTIKPVIYGGIAARQVGVRAVVHHITGLGHVFVSDGPQAAALRWGARRGYALALRHPHQRVIFQNADDRDRFLAWGVVRSEDARVIRGAGVDLQAYAPRPEPQGEPLVILPARMLGTKGVLEFVEAAALLQAEGLGARFALVGEPDPGNPASIPAAQLEAWHKGGAVEWWGRRNDMPEVYAQAAVVCLPSYGEGTPKALLEAAAAGRPIVTSDVQGCREAVRAGVTGLLVPPKDAKSLAAALGQLLQDRALRSRQGAAGHDLAMARFSQEGVVAETLAVYRELLA